MKFDQILIGQIEARFSPRKIIFMTRAKLYIHAYQQWHQNCGGFLILYRNKQCYYFAIIEVLTLKIMFDMELYSNFNNHARYLGQQKALVFLTPSPANYIRTVLVLESKQELTNLKSQLNNIYAIPDELQQKQLSFFKKPEVQEILLKAQIQMSTLQKDLLLRDQVEAQIKKYMRKVESFNQGQKKTGFKAYGLGKQEWKNQLDQINYVKQKEQAATIENLIAFNKQARIRGING